MLKIGNLSLFCLIAVLLVSTNAFVTPPKTCAIRPHQHGFIMRHYAAQESTDWNTQFRMLRYSIVRVVAAIFLVPPETLAYPPMMEPPPSSSYDLKRRKASSLVLLDGWCCDDTVASDSATNAERMYIDAVLGAAKEEKSRVTSNDITMGNPSTYGEVTEIGARQLFHYMGMTSDTEKEGDDISFFDLGSGAGKLVVQAYMEIPDLCRAVGVELSPSRHQDAVRAWGRIQSEAKRVRSITPTGLESKCSVDLFEGDMFKLNVSDATHIYVASLCFTPEMMQILAKKLEQEASKLRCFATLQSLHECWEQKFGKPRVEFVEMSWTKPRGEGCAVYFYEMNSAK